ncbi:MAG TPA: DUF308 domain-containing protein [Chthoniobacterales bacterium]|nr:DUF308 domain-containing protein [Chthoniobacterales bacterium]
MNESKAAAGGGTGSMMVWGIVMLICGILAIALPLISGLGVVIIVAWVILVAGVSHLFLAFHTHSVGGVLWQILLALIYSAAGVFILMNPLAGLVTLTLVLAVFLLIEAALETALYFQVRGRVNAGWILFDAVVTLVLAILIWSQWPSSALWFIGTIIGISLIFSGISRLMLSSAMRGKV